MEIGITKQDLGRHFLIDPSVLERVGRYRQNWF